MMGDYHVRFCERFGVKVPLSTRPQDRQTAQKLRSIFLQKRSKNRKLKYC